MTAGLLISSGSHFSPSGGKPGRGWGPLPPGGAGAGRGLPKAEGGTESPPPAFPSPTRTLAAGSGGFSREQAPALLSSLTGVCSQGGALPPALQL